MQKVVCVHISASTRVSVYHEIIATIEAINISVTSQSLPSTLSIIILFVCKVRTPKIYPVSKF
jgi:hypothetical protein